MQRLPMIPEGSQQVARGKGVSTTAPLVPMDARCVGRRMPKVCQRGDPILDVRLTPRRRSSVTHREKDRGETDQKIFHILFPRESQVLGEREKRSGSGWRRGRQRVRHV